MKGITTINKSWEIKVFVHFLLLSLNSYLYKQKCCSNLLRLRDWIPKNSEKRLALYDPNKSAVFVEGFGSFLNNERKWNNARRKYKQYASHRFFKFSFRRKSGNFLWGEKEKIKGWKRSEEVDDWCFGIQLKRFWPA